MVLPSRREFSGQYIEELQRVLAAMPLGAIAAALAELEAAQDRGQTVFLIGNGGSAATASHLGNDWLWGASRRGGPPMRALSLTDNMSLLSAVANDDSFAEVFAVPLRALARPGDLLVAISGSGNSLNLLRALEVARELGLRTIGFLGMGGGKAAAMVDVAVVVPSSDYGPIEDVHLVLDHLSTAYLRHRSEALAGGLRRAVFLDRDGVLIHDRSQLIRPEQVELIGSATEAVRRLRLAGYVLVVVSNQPIVARGLSSPAEVELVHARIQELLAQEGGAEIDRFYFCPHHPNATVAEYRQDCQCRKPRIGLLVQAARELRLDLAGSVMVGDRPSDIASGRRAGCRTVQVESGRHLEAPIESPDDYAAEVTPDHHSADLAAAADWILGEFA